MPLVRQAGILTVGAQLKINSFILFIYYSNIMYILYNHNYLVLISVN